MGVEPEYPCAIPQSFQECLPEFVDRNKISRETKMILIYLPFDVNFQTINQSRFLKVPTWRGLKGIEFYRVYSPYALQSNIEGCSVVEIIGTSPTMTKEEYLNTTLWQCHCLIIEYQVLAKKYELSVATFYRKYHSASGVFTLGDIVDRVTEFYNTPFTHDEYDCFLKQFLKSEGGTIKDIESKIDDLLTKGIKVVENKKYYREIIMSKYWGDKSKFVREISNLTINKGLLPFVDGTNKFQLVISGDDSGVIVLRPRPLNGPDIYDA